MRKALLFSLVLFSVIIFSIRYGLKPLMQYLDLEPRTGIRIESTPKAVVFIDGKEAGQTPVQKEEFIAGEYLIEVKGQKSSWRGYVELNEGTLTVVNRDLSETEASSSGEIVALQKGDGVTIISTPNAADIEVDGKRYGKTPLKVTDLQNGEHTFVLGHNNYLNRNIKAVFPKGYNLILIVDLALSSSNLTEFSETPIQTSVQFVVKKTPTGFLRVRQSPSVNSSEISRVNDGEVLVLLEDLTDWKKVRLPDGKEGYVSSQYIEKRSI